MTAPTARPGSEFRGRVVRTLDTTPRTATETFWLDGPREPWEAEPWRSESSVIAERAISGPADGPLLLWDESVGQAADLEALLADYFHGNLAARTPPADPLDRDTRGLDPASDDEFWAVIDELGGKTWQKTINAAARELAARDEIDVLRWEEAVSLKALALNEAFERAGAGEPTFPTALSVWGAVIARGPKTYAKVLADPETFDPKWLNDKAGSVLFIGSLALHRKLGVDVTVTSSLTPVHRRMLDVWHAEMRVREAARLRLSADPDALRERYFHVARALVSHGAVVHMRIVVAEIYLGADDIRPGLAVALESFGGRVCSPVEAAEGGFSGIPSGPVYEVRRRFTGTREAYLEQFIPRAR